MKYQAIILDLDGTTIPPKPDGKPSPKVLEAIQKAKEKIFVCVSTSRPLAFAKPVLDIIKPNGPCVVNDATQVYDSTNDTVLSTVYLDENVVGDVLKIMLQYAPSVMVNTGQAEYMYNPDEKLGRLSGICSPDIPHDLANMLIDKLSGIPSVAVHKPYSHKKGLYWIAVTNAKATKLHGVLTIAQYLHIKPKRIIGVGDGYNDYPLLSACGLKIAMGNANEELKAIADFVAPSQEEDGVATVIDKFVLGY